MRVVLFGNGPVCVAAANTIRANGDEIVAAALHPRERMKSRDEILAAVNWPFCEILHANECEELLRIPADIAVSAFYGYILRPEIINLFPQGVINIHNSYLPYNRGAHANVWPIIDGTPAGATVHYIDAGIDTGDIIAQTRVPVEPDDTAASLYAKLETACIDLFASWWPAIRENNHGATPQTGDGSLHYVKHLKQLDTIHMDRDYNARSLINMLRARTFPPYRGCTFEQDGKTYEVTVNICEAA